MTYITPQIVAKESLMALENNLVLAGLVHRAYSSEFQKVGSTVTIRKPTTFSSTAVGSTVSMNTVTESSVNVVLDQHLDISFQVTSVDLSLRVKDFREQLIEPAMRAHAQKIDTLIAALQVDVAGFATVSGTAAASNLTEIRKVLNVNKAPMSERYGVLHPATEAQFLSLDAFLHADKKGSTDGLREAHMGRVLGFDWYMDQNMETFTTGRGSTATVAMKGSGVAAATACTIDLIDSASALKLGDRFTVGSEPNEWFVITGGTAGAAVLATFTFAPASKSPWADNATITFIGEDGGDYTNMVFHKNAFALVSAPLEPPIGGPDYAIENLNGLSVRVVFDYTTMTKTNLCSIDLLCGVKTLDRNLAAVLLDAV